MKRLIIAALVVVVAAACGSDESGGPTPTTPGNGSTTTTTSTTSTLPGATQRELLAKARATWLANRPGSYAMTYRISCECDGGPWTIQVAGGETVMAARVGIEPGREAPYRSVEAIFDEIEAALDEGEFPVDVEYDADFGYPRSYIFNEPELPVDGGFILAVTDFEPDPTPVDSQQRRRVRSGPRDVADRRSQRLRLLVHPRVFLS